MAEVVEGRCSCGARLRMATGEWVNFYHCSPEAEVVFEQDVDLTCMTCGETRRYPKGSPVLAKHRCGGYYRTIQPLDPPSTIRTAKRQTIHRRKSIKKPTKTVKEA